MAVVLVTSVLSLPVQAQEPRYPSLFSAGVAQQPAIRDALTWLEQNFPKQVEEWILITEIPATSRHEEKRAAYVKAQLEAEGLEVAIDSIGNVIARRPGVGGGETVVIAAHLDTVHPLDTDVTVKRAGDVLRAPGVFDNSASVANMLALVRALNHANVRTRGDIIFIGTAQEELGLLGAIGAPIRSSRPPSMCTSSSASAHARLQPDRLMQMPASCVASRPFPLAALPAVINTRFRSGRARRMPCPQRRSYCSSVC
jgi:hypothetical protein